MNDFRQLALEFVLEDDEAKLASIAQRAASEIETAPANTNPVARWVEAVQPWIPGSADDAMQGVQETTDWTSRAKALEFLSRTLTVLDQCVLKPSQVKLLVAFFGAMFDVDHKAGILASATALSRIIIMKSFQPPSGRDIIQKVCALKDDFARQVAKTRLAVYELLRSLVTDVAVARHLQHNEGPPSAFMHSLLQLCQSERDPDCLMVWFDTLRFFSAEYPSSPEILQEVYGAFKAYFPITLPRTFQSGLTPEELKLQLRKCFSSNMRLASLSLPFLLGKLDQGDGVIVNVKLDVLRTIRACVEEYAHPEQSVTPYVDRIWTSLKYEVRNGEIEDTIWATIEVLKAVATRLNGDELRDFALTITRECVSDLSSQMYCTAAGRLLISVSSANVCAFVLMVSPVLTHIKENLRHPKSPTHNQDLLKILRILLETRILLTEDQEGNDFATTDPAFQTLYAEIYQSPLQMGSRLDSSDDEIKLATEAVQGAGVLVCQRAVRPPIADTLPIPSTAALLLQEGTRAEICEALFSIASRAWHEQPRKAGSDDLINETIKALRRAVEAYPSGFRHLMERGVATIRKSYVNATPESVGAIQRVSSVLAFIGCSSLRPSLSHAMRCFLGLSCTLTSELLKAMDKKMDPSVWCALAAGVLSTMRYFKDAYQDAELQDTVKRNLHSHEQSPSQSQWLSNILAKYSVLNSIEALTGATANPDLDGMVIPEPSSISELRGDFLLVGLFLSRQLYRRATKAVEDESRTGMKSLGLSDDFTGASREAEYRYLCLISDLASFVVEEMNRCGTSLQFEVFFLTLFRDDLVSLPPSAAAEVSKYSGDQASWSWLALGPLNVLSFGILKSLLPSGVLRLFDWGFAQQILIDGTSPMSSHNDAARVSVMRAILAVLANKYELEKLDEMMATIEHSLESALEQATKGTAPEDRHRGLDRATSIFTLARGLLWRCTGKQTRGLLLLLSQVPDNPVAGHLLGRGLEVITAPQPFVTDCIGSVQKPLWMQKVYVDLVKPMIGAAVSASSETQSPLVKTNYGVAVLLMVRHMSFPIYEEDSGTILRVAISTAQNLGNGLEAKAALEVVKSILVEAPDTVKDHLGSLIKICTGLFSTGPALTPRRPEWLPQGYVAATDDAEFRAGCGRCALEIVGGLPRIFETRHLLTYAPQVQRELAAACGHGSRDVRKIARLARAAWSDLR